MFRKVEMKMADQCEDEIADVDEDEGEEGDEGDTDGDDIDGDHGI